MRPSSPGTFLQHAGLPLFLVTDPVNIRYLCGASVSGAVILVTPRRFFLCVDGRRWDRTEEDVRDGIVVRPLAELARLLRGGECGFEADKVTVTRKSSWKRHFPNTKFVQKVGVVEAFRRQKEEEELRFLRRAHRLTKEILRRIPAALRAGVTEERVARQLRIWALELGADGLAFDPIVAFGTHTSLPHHRPGKRALKKGHLVQIDVGAAVQGYCADMSQVFFTARPTEQQKLVYTALLDIQKAAMLAAKPGVTNHALDRLARSMLRERGIKEDAFVHALGHGVGLEIHEGITLSERRKEDVLLAGEVVTIEPGVYFPGKFGMRVEDMVYVS